MQEINFLDWLNDSTQKYIPHKLCIGSDRYCVSMMEYYECYAKLANACYYQYHRTRDTNYLNVGRKYITRLIELAHIDPSNGYICWGLPFDNNIHEHYSGALLCNAFALEAIIKYNDVEQYSDVIISALQWMDSMAWCADECEQFYCYSPLIQQDIYNAEIIAMFVFLLLNKYIGKNVEKYYKQLKRIIGQQSNKGYWNYSATKIDVDLVHQAYCVEYLTKSLLILKKAREKTDLLDLSVAVDKSYHFLIMQLWRDGLDRYLFRWNDDICLKDKIKYLLLRMIKPFLTNNDKHFLHRQAWGCAATLNCACLARMLQIDSNTCHFVADYITKKLILPDGSIKFTECNDDIYVRHGAHIIEAMSFYAYLNK